MAASTPDNHSALSTYFLPLLAYLVVAVVYTWPLVTRFASETPGMLPTDRDMNIWNLWWFRYSLLNLHHNPFYNPIIYWPDYQSPGVPLWFHTLQPFNMTLGFFLQQFFNLVTTYNTIIFFAFILSGYGAYLLVSYVSGNRIAGFVGGLAFACSPYHLDVMRGQSNLFSTEFIPLYLYALLRLRDAVSAAGQPVTRKTISWIVVAALLLSLNNLIDWYLLIGGLLLTATLLLAYLWWARREGWTWLLHQVGAVAAVGLLWALLCSPVIIPTLVEANSSTIWKDLSEQQRLLNSSDALSFFTPASLHTLEGDVTDAFLRTLPSHSANCVGAVQECMSRISYLGFAALALAIIGAVGWWQRRSRYWLFAALVLMVLALGPVLQVATNNTGIPLPFALLVKLPLMSIMRGSNRLLPAFDICYVVLVGLGVAWLLQRGQRLRWLAAGLSILMAAEFLIFPYPTAPINAPTFFSELGQDQANYALFELPLTGHSTADSMRTRYQIFHHKAINGGYLARPLADNFSIMANVQDWFAAYTLVPDIVARPPTDTITTMFNAYNFRYVILYKHEFGKAADFGRAQTFLDRLYPAGKVFEDDTIIAYRVPDKPFTAPLILIGEGWHEAEASGGARRRWIDKERATLRLVVPTGQAGRYTLNFSAAAFAKPRRLNLALGVTQPWQQQIPTAVTSYGVPLDLNEGTNIVVLTVPDGYDSPARLGLDAKDYRNLSITLGGLSLGKP